MIGDIQLAYASDIDKVIFAKLPHANLYPKLSKAVATYMIYGLCGASRFISPCNNKDRCFKFYPQEI